MILSEIIQKYYRGRLNSPLILLEIERKTNYHF